MSYKDEVRNLYDEIGVSFSETRKKHWEVPYADLVKPGERVLDVGCGNGRLLTGLPENIEYVGIDFSKTLLKEARKMHPEGTFKQGDITQKKVWTNLGKFDAIYSSAVFHHLPHREDHLFVIKQMKQHLKKDGFIYLSSWNLWNKQYFWKHHLKSWKLKFKNWRWLYVPYQNKHQRFCTALDLNYLESLAAEGGLKVEQSRYVSKKGKEASIWDGDNMEVVLRAA